MHQYSRAFLIKQAYETILYVVQRCHIFQNPKTLWLWTLKSMNQCIITVTFSVTFLTSEGNFGFIGAVDEEPFELVLNYDYDFSRNGHLNLAGTYHIKNSWVHFHWKFIWLFTFAMSPKFVIKYYDVLTISL